MHPLPRRLRCWSASARGGRCRVRRRLHLEGLLLHEGSCVRLPSSTPPGPSARSRNVSTRAARARPSPCSPPSPARPRRRCRRRRVAGELASRREQHLARAQVRRDQRTSACTAASTRNGRAAAKAASSTASIWSGCSMSAVEPEQPSPLLVREVGQARLLRVRLIAQGAARLPRHVRQVAVVEYEDDPVSLIRASTRRGPWRCRPLHGRAPDPRPPACNRSTMCSARFTRVSLSRGPTRIVT